MAADTPSPDQDFRIARLREAVMRYGNEQALGVALNWKNGAFVRQMLRGKRAITEKTAIQIEALPGMEGWFQRPDTPLELTAAEVAMILTFRAQLRSAPQKIGASRLSGAKILTGKNIRAGLAAPTNETPTRKPKE